MGGFECSTHWTRRGVRLDVTAATAHDKFALADYQRLRAVGMATARDGLRWHLIERAPYVYDFSSVLPMLRAAREAGVQVMWDICHYGWPDDLDIFSPEFVKRFAALARAFTELFTNETDETPFIAPINEISFFSWAGGTSAFFNPFSRGRGAKLKRQLVRAAIAGVEAIWEVEPRARIIHTDPLVNIVCNPKRPHEREAAEHRRLAQFEGWDMLTGRLHPELGGDEKYLDIIGVNFYPHNQWFFQGGRKITRSHSLYRPFREMLGEADERYRRPMFIAETGAESEARPEWLRYVCEEARAARESGISVEGLCLYPVVNHPGWDDDRHCHNGLWDYADEFGGREIYRPLADELHRQQMLFKEAEPSEFLPAQETNPPAFDEGVASW